MESCGNYEQPNQPVHYWKGWNDRGFIVNFMHFISKSCKNRAWERFLFKGLTMKRFF